MAQEKIEKSQILGIVVCGNIFDNEKEAWASFDEELKSKLFWTRGFKYWRKVPELYDDKDFFSEESKFVVRARITASMRPLKNAKPVRMKKPYPTEGPYKETDFGLGNLTADG